MVWHSSSKSGAGYYSPTPGGHRRHQEQQSDERRHSENHSPPKRHSLHILDQIRHHSHLKQPSAGVPGEQGNGVIYTMASDFIHPNEVDKNFISGPMSARPMGDIDITANDWILSSSAPSRQEMHILKKHAKETAHALGTSSKKFLSDANKG
ncbi:hypothetical protein GGI07_002639 [Coemansia sp. Benny D115]|nr:hypothetical protein GGI07_002639 [Coemansia sp. Benny D115]